MIAMDRFMWFGLTSALILGTGLALALRSDISAGTRALTLVVTAAVYVLYLVNVRYLVRRRRRLRP